MGNWLWRRGSGGSSQRRIGFPRTTLSVSIYRAIFGNGFEIAEKVFWDVGFFKCGFGCYRPELMFVFFFVLGLRTCVEVLRSWWWCERTIMWSVNIRLSRRKRAEKRVRNLMDYGFQNDDAHLSGPKLRVLFFNVLLFLRLDWSEYNANMMQEFI